MSIKFEILFRMLNRLRNSKLISRILSYRSLKTASALKAGAPHAPVTQAAETKSVGFLRSLLVVPEDPRVHRGYLYREFGNLQGSNQATIAYLTLSVAWFWIFYNLWSHPENLLGHAPYPDTAKWTNAELGIPADDEE